MTRVLIVAAGVEKRWNNHNGTPRHLTVVEKEVLIERTANQFLKYTDQVCVVAPDSSYAIDGAKLYIIKTSNTFWQDAAKFLSSKALWNPDGRTVIVFGDVWFTPDAVNKIMKNKDSFKWFLRKDGSKITGKQRREIFAFSFHSSQADSLLQTLLHAISVGACSENAEWAWYKATTGPTNHSLFANSHYIEIDDWTEDFDYPVDLTTWETLRKESRKKTK